MLGSLALLHVIGSGVDHIAASSSVEAFLALDVREGLAYAVAVFFFVLSALIAPSHRAAAAVVLFGCGAFVAWLVLRDWYFPEGHWRAYQPSNIPLGLTLLGGILGVCAVTVYEQLRRTRGET